MARTKRTSGEKPFGTDEDFKLLHKYMYDNVNKFPINMTVLVPINFEFLLLSRKPQQ